MILDCHDRKSKIAIPPRQSKIQNRKSKMADRRANPKSKIENLKLPTATPIQNRKPQIQNCRPLSLPLAFTPQQRYNRRANFERSVSHV